MLRLRIPSALMRKARTIPRLVADEKVILTAPGFPRTARLRSRPIAKTLAADVKTAGPGCAVGLTEARHLLPLTHRSFGSLDDKDSSSADGMKPKVNTWQNVMLLCDGVTNSSLDVIEAADAEVQRPDNSERIPAS